MTRGHSGVRSLFLLAAVVLGFNLRSDGSTVQPSEALAYRPALQPSEAAPLTGTYTLKTPAGKPCIKATLGVEYIVIEKLKKKNSYFNLDPRMVSTSGYCGNKAAVLSLTLPSNTTSLQLTFTREGNISYVSRLSAHIFPLPLCRGCASKIYSGVLSDDKLFKAAYGRSFRCHAGSEFAMADELRVKLVPLQVQAFTVPEGEYGQEEECLADYNRRVIPVIMGAVAVTLMLIAVISFLVIRDHHTGGYERM